MLVGSSLSAVFAFLLGFNLGLALTFALSLTMLVTAIRLRVKIARLELKPVGGATVRVIKGEEAKTELDAGPLAGSDSAVALSVLSPAGVAVNARMAEAGRLELSVKPKYAGLFLGLTVVLGVKDELGVFVAEKSARLDAFRVESIPASLVAEARTSLASWMTFAESPASAKGHGQEVYSIEEATQPEARSVYWKGVAKSPEERLTVIVREAGLTSSVTVGVINSDEVGVMRLGWMDLACEALAKLSRGLLDVGTDVEIITPSRAGLTQTRASSLPQLMQCMMRVFEDIQTNANVAELVRRSDVILVDSEMLRFPATSHLLAGKTTVAISPEGASRMSEGDAYIFSGTENLDEPLMEALQG